MLENADSPLEGHDCTALGYEPENYTKRDLTTWFSARGGLVPLFETRDQTLVETREYGEDNLPYLDRSEEMERLVTQKIEQVRDDYHDNGDTFEGMMYAICVRDGEQTVPLYIGGANKYGSDGHRLNENMTTRDSKFGRLGYGQNHHLGALSAVVLQGYGDTDATREYAPRYERWAETLFEARSRRLKQPVYVWAHTWRSDEDNGLSAPSTLDKTEDELIRIASRIYPDRILNIQGTV